MKYLQPDDIIDMTNAHTNLRIDLVYAHDDNLLFGERIYRPEARLWLHRDLAHVIIVAADLLQAQNYRLVLYDGLRTVDAQEKMLHTKRVQQNSHWLQEPRLLSPPGKGAHPRGMAIDCALETDAGALLDMGTPFDYLAENAAPKHNPAHRDYPGLSAAAKTHRNILHNAIWEGAAGCGVEIMGLPQEWWDYRLPAAVYEQYAPLRDADLPPPMRMA
ncbi:MAG: D-alanyl-D-alanine carboxypeptidase family protein [Alphaproteobacteria bacterium]|nr:D-alanyl-D-alanine carboxypeptidase family protein [Alphaproteobacteria bacterium]